MAEVSAPPTGNAAPFLSIEFIPGDFNTDGSVDAADYTIWRDHLGVKTNAAVADGDADRDGDVDQFDYQTLRANFGRTASGYLAAQAALPGDFNHDATVDAADYSVWRDHVGMTSGATSEHGDGDGNGAVDGADYLLWKQNYGATAPQASRVLAPLSSRDDGDWGYSERGVWQTGTLEGGWQDDYRVQAPGTGNKSADWVTILPAAQYEVFATWVPDANHATDAKYHIIDGASQLATVVRDQTAAPIDANFNGRKWESLGVYTFSTGVPTVRLTNDASGFVVADGVLFVPAGDCAFDANLTGWRVTEDGGTPTGHGGVSSVDCAAVLSEGDSFRVSLEQSFVVPQGATSLSFRYDSLNFDTSDPNFINDAFEVALVDETGASMVPTYTGDFTRDAFLNISEDLPAALGQGVTLSNGVVTVSLAGVAAGAHARLIFRLANDDQDVGTSVRIVDVALPAGAAPLAENSSAKFFVVDATADAVFRYGSTGADLNDFALSPVAQNARGVASSADGSVIWTIDGTTRRVHVQGPDGTSLGSWRTSGLSSPQGVTVHNNDLWAVDSDLNRVVKFDGAVTRRSGESAPSSFFALDAANSSPSDLVTDGVSIWVTDDAADAVFVYSLAGALQGSWLLDSNNAHVSGITLDPSGAVADLWTVDRVDRQVYRYANAMGRVNGSQSATDTFVLVDSNTAPEGIADPPIAQVKFQKSQFTVRPESFQVIATPAVIDVNEDGVSDIIFGTYDAADFVNYRQNGLLRAISGSDGSELWTVVDSRYELRAEGGVAVGDIDNDGLPEIIAVHESHAIIAFENDGSFKWMSPVITGAGGPFGPVGFGAPSLADLDADGSPEIIVGASVLNKDGTIRWEGLLNGGQGTGQTYGSPLSIVADLDLDGVPEIVAGKTAYRASGAIYWNADIPDGLPGIANLDGDAFPEILVVSNGRLYILEHDGTQKQAPIDLPGGGLGGPPTVADVDGDGLPEIGVAGNSKYIVFEHDGTVKWTANTKDGSSQTTGSSVFDLDGDGNAEVIYGDEAFLFIYEGATGNVLYSLPKSSGTLFEMPIVVDLEGDGHAEIIAVANSHPSLGPENGIFVVESSSNDWTATRQIWNQHSYHITNINDDGTIPRVELNSWELYNNYRRNQQVTGTRIFPPTISASAARSAVPVGDTVLITGRATADGQLAGGAANRIVAVTINGAAVDVLDVGGEFFAAVRVQPGENRFDFVAFDAAGQEVFTTVVVAGTQLAPNSIDFSRYADITGSFSGVYGRTSFMDEADALLVELATRNDGTFATDVPLLVGVTNLRERGTLNASVGVLGADGVTPDGVPYFDFSKFVGNNRLAPGETTGSPVVSFYNPNRVKFDYDLVFYGKLNTPPVISSVPDVEALIGRPYSYQVTATDEDGDALAYELASGPAGLTMSATGLISWTPTTAQSGNHSVAVKVSDGRGGVAEQRYTVSAIVAPPNRPPVITSAPVTMAAVAFSSDVAATFEMPATIRDFSDAHSDFEAGVFVVASGLVASELGLDGKPRFVGPNGRAAIASEESFNQWFNDVPGVNHGTSITLPLSETAPGTGLFTYSNGLFFPIDGQLGGNEGRSHNYHYTMEVHTDFRFEGGEVFSFTGDDDVWVFINNELVVDLGGVHGPISGSIALDTLGLTPGQRFSFDLFFAERHTSGSSFSLTTSIDFRPDPTYLYEVKAVDPDADSLSYRLLVAPEGMDIGSSSGFISWAPTAKQVGNHSVKVEVTDGRGGVATQEFVVCVKPDPANHAPIITSEPLTTAQSPRVATSSPTSLSFDDLTGVFYEQGTPVASDSILRDQYLNNYGVRFSSDGPVDYVAIVNLDSRGSGHATSAPNGIAGVSVDGRLSYSTPIIARFYLPGEAGVSAVTDYVSVRSDTAGNSGVNKIEAYDSQGLLLASATATDDGVTALVVTTPGIASVRIVGSGSAGFDDFTFNPLRAASVYQYDVSALDPDNDSLIYRLAQAPSGMTIASDSGLISWTASDMSTFTSIDPRATYLHTSGSDSATNAHPIDLASLGLVEGDLVQLRAIGDFSNHPSLADYTSGMTGVFSSTAELASPSVLNRVSGSVQAGLPYETIGTFPARELTDIPEDFLISDDVTNAITIRIPIGAKYLFVGAIDSLWADNSDSDVNFGVVVTPLEASFPITVRVEDGRGGFDEQSFTLELISGTGEIRGTKFADNIADGARLISQIDIVDSYSAVNNPNGQWSYGYKTGLTSAAFIPYGNNFEFAPGLTAWSALNDFSTPLVAHNTDSALLNFGGGIHLIDGIELHPGPNGEVSVARFTVLESGYYSVDGSFSPGDLAFGSTDAHVFIGGQEVFSQDVSGLPVAFNVPLRFLETGSFIEFVVGWGPNQDFFYDNTNLKAKIVHLDPGLADWIIYLDQNNNSRRDVGELSAVTDANGDYAFTGLPAGTYIVREEPQAGWRQTYPGLPATGGHLVAIGNSQISIGIDFGNTQIATGPNENPTFISIAPTTTAFGSLFRYDALASDPENSPLAYSLIAGPAGMTLNPQTGTVVWQPQEGQLGEHTVTLRVVDDRGGVAVQQFSLTVVAPNAAPVFTSTPVLQAVEGRPVVYDVGVLDADGDLVAVSLAAGSVGVLVPSEVRGPNNELLQTRYRFTWTPTAADLAAGSRTVTLLADDGRGGRTEQTFSLQIVATATNRAPEILSAPRTVAYPGLPYVYPVKASDADGNPLTYSLATKPGNMAISSDGVITWTPPGDAAGANTVRVIVSDGQGGETAQEFSLRVASQGENTAPQITSNPPQSGRHDKLYVYNAVAIDAQGDPLVWSLDAAPIGMSIDAATGAIRWTPREDQIGARSVTLRATDPFGASAVQSFSIEVACTNTPPLILSTPATQAAVGEGYFYGVRAVDPDGDPLSYSLSSGPSTMTISPSGLVRWTPTAADEGQTRTVVVRVDDADGGFVLQEYRVEVTAATNLNRAPVITSAPVFAVTLGDAYEYLAEATDADGNTLTFSLPVKPAWLNIEPTTGRLFGTPPTTGIDAVVLQVSDGTAVATQGFAVNVRANSAPTINSTAPTSTTVGANYRYSVRATDADGDPLSYTVNGPAGMTIDGLGRVTWTVPVDAATGAPVNVPVSVTVADSRGATARQDFTVVVSPDTQAPTVSVQVQVGDVFVNPTDSIDLGATATIRVTASDNVGVTTLALEVDGQMIALDPQGRATVTAATLGPIVLLAKARDLAGNEGVVSRLVKVIDPAVRNRPVDPNRNDTPVVNDPTLPTHPGFAPGDNRAPTVAITSPLVDASVTNLAQIIGTIDDPEDHLWYWRAYVARLDQVDLDYIDLNNPNLKQIAQGTNEVHDAQIATFDPTLLTNDAYAILVAAFDVNGQGYVAATTVNVEGNVKLGEFRLEFTDLTIPLAGIPIQLSRVYDSREAGVAGDFGYGWMLGVQSGRILETVPPGPGAGLFSEGMPFVPGKTKVYITNPSGQRVGFTYDERLLSGGFFGATYQPVFKPDPGVYDTLEAPGTVTRGLFGFVDYNPSEYTLTTKDGLKYLYTQSGGLQTITDRNANVITFTPGGIQHSSGVKIDFVRDARGRITQLVAPDGTKILYDYNARGELTKVTSQSGTTTRYTYLDRPAHYLDEGFDARGERAFKVTYDDQGRYVAIIDALGNTVQQQNYDELADRRATVLDANGNPTRLLYDERGNVIEETDPAGNVTVRGYGDPRNPDLETKIIDREGNVTQRQYDARGNVMKIVELGHTDAPLATPIVTEFAYNSRNDVTSIKNANGSSTVFAYDPKGNLTGITNAANKSSSFTYDSMGRRKSFTDFAGNTTTFVYEGNNSQPHEAVAADGTKQRFAYNQFGQVTLAQTFEANGVLVEQKQTFYDASGRVTREVAGANGADPLHGAVEVRKFYDGDLLDWEIVVNPLSLNPNGSLKESPATPVDQRLSRITDYDYDAASKLVAQTDAEGGVVRFRYDAQGNRVLLQDPVGNITTWTYDTLNRVAEERDPFYWVAFVAANAALPVDALLSSVVEENKLPSGADINANQGAAHVRVFGYDGEGNQQKVIDRNDRRREFEYDLSGRLTEERWYAAGTDALVETITFQYDAVGNMLVADDSNSHYVFTYDALNRLRTVDNADGVAETPDVLLTYEYDAQGNVIKTYDDAGVTVESVYSSRNLLASRKWYDAVVPTGEVADVADARIDFTYNATGRQSRVDRYSDLAATVRVGHTDTTYDLSGRTDVLRHMNAIDELLSGYDYGYDFGGLATSELRDHQDNQYDQTVSYGYDRTGQLVDALFSGQDDEHYRYDANGNRLSATVGATATTYAPAGSANQLTSDGTYRYEYDGEGNLVRKTGITLVDDYQLVYDHLNRVIAITRLGDSLGTIEGTSNRIVREDISFDFDPLGRRTIASIGHQADSQTTSHSQHFTFDGAQIWSSSETGQQNHFGYGSQIDAALIDFHDISNARWLLADAVGTIRDVADLGEHSEYSAFGVQTSDVQLVFGLTGREPVFNSQWVYFRSRIYDANTGRFTSQDITGFDGGDNNLYRYVNNSPANATDPTGLTEIPSYSIINVETLTVTRTVAQNIATRPFIKSSLLIRSILEKGIPVGDASVKTAFKWVAEGTFNGSRGFYELVIDTANNRILHFLFRSL